LDEIEVGSIGSDSKKKICGRDFCRACGHKSLYSGLNLGELPIANELWSEQKLRPERFPLHLRICGNCGLGQVQNIVTSSRLFADYRYLSSVSSSFVEHARVYVSRMLTEIDFGPTDWILEIASNDGYLLQFFKDAGVDYVGIEPAKNVAAAAIARGINTRNVFFDSSVAQALLEEKGAPKLIIANNVLAHVPDLMDFMKGLSILTGNDTLLSVENPSLVNIISLKQFDTIYHEHFSYLTAKAVLQLCQSVDLDLYSVEKIATHGGSNRYLIRRKKSSRSKNLMVSKFIDDENLNGTFDENRWVHFGHEVEEILFNFRIFLEKKSVSGQRVSGYGAAAKASTLLNAAEVKREWVYEIADSSHEKQGRFLPSEGIPIVSPKEMFANEPDDIIIFPWNISKEIKGQIDSQSKGNASCWQVLPTMHRVQ